MSLHEEVLTGNLTVTDCLAWSEDGLLAIAADAYIHILIAKYDADQSLASASWARATFIATRFSPQEWPLFQPAPSKLMSLGKEQAEVSVVAMQWSPQGLALHRRPVLAILTSNLVVSLWASDSDPSVSDSWSRVMVVNWHGSGNHQAWRDFRAMAWAPRLSLPSLETPFSKWKWGIPVLAVADADDEVHYLEISSPMMAGCDNWYSRDIDRRSPSTKATMLPDVLADVHRTKMGRQTSRASLLNQSMEGTQPVEKIIIGPWDIKGVHARTEVSIFSGEFVSKEKLALVSADPATELSFRIERTQAEVRPVPGPKVDSRVEEKLPSIPKNMQLRGISHYGSIVALCMTHQSDKELRYKIETPITITITDSESPAGSNSSTQKQHYSSPKDSRDRIKRIVEVIHDREVLASTAQNAISQRILYGSLYLRVHLNTMEAHAQSDALQFVSTMEAILGTKLDAERNLMHVHSKSEVSKNVGSQIRKACLAANQRVLVLDACPACDEDQTPLFWDDLSAARCQKGHTFGRCALTFLPILNPAYQKECMSCGREYLNDLKHPELASDQAENLKLFDDTSVVNVGSLDYASSDASHRAPTTRQRPFLANYLFEVFDTCPYCDGLFSNKHVPHSSK